MIEGKVLNQTHFTVNSDKEGQHESDSSRRCCRRFLSRRSDTLSQRHCRPCWPRREPRMETPATRPKALIVPHAGYIYSGPIAASAYAQLDTGPRQNQARGAAGPGAPRAGARPRPAGRGQASQHRSASCRWIRRHGCRSPACRRWWNSAAAHALEHSLEVQLPFLQRCWTISTWCRWRWATPRRRKWPKCWNACGAGRKR